MTPSLIESSAITADQMRQVLAVARLLALTPDIDTLLTRIAQSATSLLSAERASIFLFDSKTNELWTKVALKATEIRVPCDKGIVGLVFGDNELLHVPNPYEHPRFNPEFDKRNNFVTRNLLTMPTRDTGRHPIGVLQVVNRVGGDFDEADKLMIEMLAEQAGVAIQRHYLMQDFVKSAELRRETEIALKVQMAMIPEHPPTIPGLQAAGWTLPASVTGGDTYDLWTTPDGHLGIFLGDAAGHGIAPAIEVTQARTMIRMLSEMNLNQDPTWQLSSINARLAQDLSPGQFITVFVGAMSPAGLLRWSSAGHGPMLYRKGLTGPFEMLEPLGPPVGVMPEFVGDPTGELQLDPGGIFMVLSDGIFEARSAVGEFMDVDRIRAFFDGLPPMPPEQIILKLRQMLVKYQGKESPSDDQTAVIIQRAQDCACAIK